MAVWWTHACACISLCVPRNLDAAGGNLGCMPLFLSGANQRVPVFLPVKADGLLVLQSLARQDFPALVFLIKETQAAPENLQDLYGTLARAVGLAAAAPFRWVLTRACDPYSQKSPMLSCGFRNIWRALINGKAELFDYDKLVMPLLSVCGSDVYVAAGIVLNGKGETMLASPTTPPWRVHCVYFGSCPCVSWPVLVQLTMSSTWPA